MTDKPCPCETHGSCDVYQELLRGEVNSMEYVKHLKRVTSEHVAAAEKDRDRFRAGRDWQYDMAKGWRDRALAAEERLAELDAMLKASEQHVVYWESEDTCGTK